MIFFVYILVMLISIYIGSLLSYILGNLINTPKKISHHMHPVSVIVAVKNGENSLPTLLNDLKKQKYQGQIEYIIVDDESTDKSAEIIKKICKNNSNFKYLSSLNGNPKLKFKKRALDAGIYYSKNEILLFTDVDCRLNENWIESMINCFKNDVDYVIGVSKITNPDNIISIFQKIDLFMMMVAGRGKTNLKQPIACTGQNQAYKKHLYFENNGFTSINNSIQGDDSLFMNICFKNNANIYFNDNHESFVESRKEYELNSFIQQRIRWAADAKVMWNYNKKFFITLISTFTVNSLLLLTPLFISFISEQNQKMLLLLFLTKFLLELIIYIIGCIKLKSKIQLFKFTIWFLLNIPYVFITGTANLLNKNIVWKGQTIHK